MYFVDHKDICSQSIKISLKISYSIHSCNYSEIKVIRKRSSESLDSILKFCFPSKVLLYYSVIVYMLDLIYT